MTEIGQAIREARQAKHMTIKELAERAGVDERTVGRIERGEVRNPSKAGQLQRVLGIGIYASGRDQPAGGDSRDPLLSEATMSELLAAVANRYGDVVRSSRFRTPEPGDVTELDELPPDVLALGPDRVAGEWVNPSGGRSSG
ncbi:MAG TPA: helix-turn-helix transcriptional regulator [Methylomirabilota bacterium]|nr:helix-turn-helix transcriptional regulator [Methylomirabilota bacterium]